VPKTVPGTLAYPILFKFKNEPHERGLSYFDVQGFPGKPARFHTNGHELVVRQLLPFGVFSGRRPGVVCGSSSSVRRCSWCFGAEDVVNIVVMKPLRNLT
jgi:hypothetical protein